MTEKGYNIHEIVAQVRSAGNPQMAAMEAIADNKYLVDSELLEALGVMAFGDLPTTPYPDAPMRTRTDSGGQAAPSPDGPRKKPGPKPGAKRKRRASQNAPARSGTLRDALGRALGVLEEFASVWGSVLSDPHGPFSAAQVEALAQIDEAASIWLSGWDAATMMLIGGDNHDN